MKCKKKENVKSEQVSEENEEDIMLWISDLPDMYLLEAEREKDNELSVENQSSEKRIL